MNYYLDTEFVEGSQKNFWGKTKPTIDLISIGIVAEDGRMFYAISKDFNLKEAWNRYDLKTTYGDERMQSAYKQRVYWIRNNVLLPIFDGFYPQRLSAVNFRPEFTYRNMKRVIRLIGRSRKAIAADVIEFCQPRRKYSAEGNTLNYSEVQNPVFYAYYGNYDWVAFMWLFGKMLDKPSHFPMYQVDLKQILDEKANKALTENRVRTTLSDAILWIKNQRGYPRQENEHNALADAMWNKELHEFLNTI